jgi:predicted fused transcriptional regulator/phosphomethylpyrimidine kinase
MQISSPQPVAAVVAGAGTGFNRVVRALSGALKHRRDRSLENVKFTDALERELVERTYATAALPRRWFD